jgi:hypothetical protein
MAKVFNENRGQQVVDLAPLNGVFGYPPSTYLSDDMIINSMPVIEIYPSTPVFESGLTLFRVEDAWEDYSKMLENNGFRLKDHPRGPLKLAFIADSFPTESFSNDYGESFLQKFTDVATQGISEILQMTGSKTLGEGVGKVASGMEEFGASGTGILHSAVGGAGSLTKRAMGELSEFKRAAQNSNSAMGKAFGGAVDILDKLMAGHRVDFPVIWRNAGFNPNYQITVRLYNPNPGNLRSTEHNIIGPLASILLLGIPGSQDGRTYTWPYFHKIRCSALFELDPAVITNITVIKGGDQQQIAYNQRLSIVDVRIDFRSVFNSMLFERTPRGLGGRPILRNYLRYLGEDDPTIYRSRDQMRRSHSGKSPKISAESRKRIANESIKRRRSKTRIAEVKDRAALCDKLIELDLLTRGLYIYRDKPFAVFSIGGINIRVPEEVLDIHFPKGVPWEDLVDSCQYKQS